jgi:hypothetical protein
MAANHPDQRRLTGYLDYVSDLMAAPLREQPGPLAVQLDVGMGPYQNLLAQRDLGNYLLPVVKRLTTPDVDIVSCWATKSRQLPSLLRVAPALEVDIPDGLGVRAGFITTASGESVDYKCQVRDAVDGLDELADGPVSLEIAFVVGRPRNWLNLWKPTIDALGPILGTTSDKPWNPRDGRITRLGLHCRVDPQPTNQVRIELRAHPLTAAEFDRGDQFVYRSGGPVDEVFEYVLTRRGDVEIARMVVALPPDDDNLWYFTVAADAPHSSVQIGTHDGGRPPFLVEGDGTGQRLTTSNITEAAQTIVDWL